MLISSETPLPSHTSSMSNSVTPLARWYCTTARRAGTMPLASL